MSSISVGELKVILDEIPEDYEVIMRIDENSIAFIDGVKINNDWSEVELLHR